MLFLHSFPHKLRFIPFGHFAIVFQNIRTLRITRGDIVMVHIVPISPPLFFRPPKFIVWVVSWYFDFCHLRVKKIKEQFRTDIPEITLKRTDKSYSPLYSLSPDYTSGGLVEQTPLLLGFRQIPAYKSIVPLQGFEPCFVPRLSRCLRIWALWLIPSDPHISGKMEVFSLPWNNPRKKTWLRIKDEPNS